MGFVNKLNFRSKCNGFIILLNVWSFLDEVGKYPPRKRRETPVVLTRLFRVVVSKKHYCYHVDFSCSNSIV